MLWAWKFILQEVSNTTSCVDIIETVIAQNTIYCTIFVVSLYRFSVLNTTQATCLDMLKKKLTRTDGWLKISSNGSPQFTLHIKEQWQMSSSTQSFYKKCNNHWKHQYKYSTTRGHKFLVIPLWSVLMDIYWIAH